ncbi:MAG TPA: hypothetical protein PKC45_14835 [Gemmatales bacterium]|nr:hypothetical protein [Gemmatales bacterium]
MPGTRDGNLRGGDLCEGLGLALLRPFALVAPVPRSEDVGADAIATLVQRRGRRLLAEESFLVQVKAASVRIIEFRGEALDWLRALRLPLYLLSVDLATPTLELRSTVRASGRLNYADRTSVTMYFDERPFDMPGDDMHVWLGPPILRWTPADAADRAFQQTAYEVLKAWISFEMEAIGLRTLGMTKQVTWEANCKPKSDDGYAILHRPSELKNTLERICPHIQRLTSLAFPVVENGSDDLLVGLLLVSRFMRGHGVDPDPSNLLGALTGFRAKAGRLNVQAAIPAEPSAAPDRGESSS